MQGSLPEAVAHQLPALQAAPTHDKCMVMWSETMKNNSFPLIAKQAVVLLSAHATSCASERNWSLWGNIYVKARNRLSLDRAEKLVFIRGNSRTPSTAQDDEKLLELLSTGPDVVEIDG